METEAVKIVKNGKNNGKRRENKMWIKTYDGDIINLSLAVKIHCNKKGEVFADHDFITKCESKVEAIIFISNLLNKLNGIIE